MICENCKHPIREDEDSQQLRTLYVHAETVVCIRALGRKVRELERELWRIGNEQSAVANGMTVP